MSDLSGLSSIGGTLSALQDTGLREFIEANSGSWTGGETILTGDAQGALDKVYSDSGKWLTGDFSGNGQPITFTDKSGNILYNDKMVLTNYGLSAHTNYNYGYHSDLRLDTFSGLSAYEGRESEREYAWGLNSAGVYYYDGPNSKNWSGIKNTDIALNGDGKISAISGHELAGGGTILTGNLLTAANNSTVSSLYFSDSWQSGNSYKYGSWTISGKVKNNWTEGTFLFDIDGLQTKKSGQGYGGELKLCSSSLTYSSYNEVDGEQFTNNWYFNSAGIGGTYSVQTGQEWYQVGLVSWSALRNVDLGLTTGGTVSSISGHELTVAGGDYLTTADSANFYTTANESGFITGVDLSPYQTTAGMTAYIPARVVATSADATGSNILYVVTGE